MQIGEILLERGWVDWEALALALTDQRGTGARLCSLLVSRGVVDFDHASLALGEQHGCAAVMRRHLERRDRTVASVLPSAMARKLVALPIGRLGNGTLIVCVRDPWPALHATLARAIGEDIVLAVAPARYLERIVEHTYADIDVPIDVESEDDAAQFDVDLDEPGQSFDDIPIEIESRQSAEDIPIEIESRQSAEDIPVEIETAPEPAKPKSRALPVEIKRPEATAAARDSLDTTIASFADIDELEWLFDVVMGYVAKRWSAALLLAIGERRATGVRGHGRRLKPRAVKEFMLVLGEPSLVQAARDERRLVTEPPGQSGIGHANLVGLLDAKQPAAAPIVKDDAVSYALVVGDPVEGDAEAAALDLEVLAEAMSAALERM